jgi:radical SAM superfamily enzyme YgiQ (UPF0313 family)
MLPISYETPLYRPPAEAESLLLQVTIGCSHNRCSYCGMYRGKRYRVRTLPEITNDLEKAAEFCRRRGLPLRKIFMCDGDALAAPSETLEAAARRASELFPKLRRIGIYASVRNIIGKSVDELRRLSEHKLRLAYLGLESGSDEVLRLVEKGSSAAEAVEAAARLREAGWQLSLIVMLGLGGRALAKQHRLETARVVSAMSPEFFSLLTTVAVPGTPYHAITMRGEIEPLTVRELLEEMRDLLEGIEGREKKIIFRANHVSNQFPLEGILPRDRALLLDTLEEWIRLCPEGVYPETDPGNL